MLMTPSYLAVINTVIQLDPENKPRTFPIAELTTASGIFSEIKKHVKDDKFIEGDIVFTSEQNVFIGKLIDERNWGVNDAETIFALRELIK